MANRGVTENRGAIMRCRADMENRGAEAPSAIERHKSAPRRAPRRGRCELIRRLYASVEARAEAARSPASAAADSAGTAEAEEAMEAAANG